jgi:hypothetical protein
MSGSAAVSPKPSVFLETIIAFLLPYFTTGTTDPNEARTEILETLASYATHTRAEMLQAAQIIAFGMATLDVLAEATTGEMSMSMRIRFRGCANGLNRSTLQTEKALDRRLASGRLAASEAVPESGSDVADAEPIAANRPATARPAFGTAREGRNQRLWAGAMMDAVKQMGIPLHPTPGG